MNTKFKPGDLVQPSKKFINTNQPAYVFVLAEVVSIVSWGSVRIGYFKTLLPRVEAETWSPDYLELVYSDSI